MHEKYIPGIILMIFFSSTGSHPEIHLSSNVAQLTLSLSPLFESSWWLLLVGFLEDITFVFTRKWGWNNTRPPDGPPARNSFRGMLRDPVVTFPAEGFEETNVDEECDIECSRPGVSVTVPTGHVVNGVLHVDFFPAARALYSVLDTECEVHFPSWWIEVIL
jgi:hypothetical protein